MNALYKLCPKCGGSGMVDLIVELDRSVVKTTCRECKLLHVVPTTPTAFKFNVPATMTAEETAEFLRKQGFDIVDGPFESIADMYDDDRR